MTKSKTNSDTGHLQVIARAPFHIYFEGEAQVISAENKVGPFDILPDHADFFSMLKPCEIKIETDEDTISFNTSNGIISVQNNEVLLFVNM